jgi:hypothetical protein
MTPEEIALGIAIIVIVILFLYPSNKSTIKDMENNVKEIKRERLKRMQK